MSLLAAGLLSACGGSGTTDDILISNITVAPTRFAGSSIITVAGSGLNQGIAVAADTGCDNVTELPGGDNLVRRYTCTVSAVGGLVIRARTGTRREVGRVQFTVPDPQVALSVTGVDTAGQRIVVTLDAERAPISVRNFLTYVNEGFYNGVLFHRVDPSNGVVQSGGFTSGPQLKTTERPPIALESRNGLQNLRGTIGMARTSAPNSATSQFYFNVRDNPGFNFQSEAAPGFAVFGRVTEGQSIIDAIFGVPTGNAAVVGADGTPVIDPLGRPFTLTTVPLSDIVIRSAVQTR